MNAPLFLLSLSAATLAQAAVVSVNFGPGSNNLAPSDNAGQPGSLVSQWYNISSVASFTDIPDDAGLSTSLDVTVQSGGQFSSWSSGTAQQNMIFGVFGDRSGQGLTSTLSFADVPYAMYDVVVYLGKAPWENSRQVDTTIGSTTYFSTVNSFDGTTFTQSTATTSGGRDAGNYVIFSGLSLANFDLTATFTSPDANAWGSGISGVQIVQSIPEPGSYAALAGGLALGLVALRRRR